MNQHYDVLLEKFISTDYLIEKYIIKKIINDNLYIDDLLLQINNDDDYSIIKNILNDLNKLYIENSLGCFCSNDNKFDELINYYMNTKDNKLKIILNKYNFKLNNNNNFINNDDFFM